MKTMTIVIYNTNIINLLLINNNWFIMETMPMITCDNNKENDINDKRESVSTENEIGKEMIGKHYWVVLVINRPSVDVDKASWISKTHSF